MHCKHCGKKIEDDSKFCSFCGGKTLSIEENIENVQEEKKISSLENILETSKDEIQNDNYKPINLFLIWAGFNAFALITSYSKLAFFNKHSPETEDFWPFVKVFEYVHPGWNPAADGPTPPEDYWDFNGLFYNYDWSEFMVYIGFVGLYLIISKNSKTQTK